MPAPGPAMTRDELLDLAAKSPTCDLPIAGRAWGLGTNRSYELAAAGEFPCRVLRVGKRYRVPVAALLESLGIDPRDVERVTEREPSIA